jgi:hypothetical protein
VRRRGAAWGRAARLEAFGAQRTALGQLVGRGPRVLRPPRRRVWLLAACASQQVILQRAVDAAPLQLFLEGRRGAVVLLAACGSGGGCASVRRAARKPRHGHDTRAPSDGGGGSAAARSGPARRAARGLRVRAAQQGSGAARDDSEDAARSSWRRRGVLSGRAATGSSGAKADMAYCTFDFVPQRARTVARSLCTRQRQYVWRPQKLRLAAAGAVAPNRAPAASEHLPCGPFGDRVSGRSKAEKSSIAAPHRTAAAFSRRRCKSRRWTM